jgi:N-methylhydantoinase A
MSTTSSSARRGRSRSTATLEAKGIEAMGGIVGIDVGGTFTDLYYSGDAQRPHRILKVPSTPHDPSVGLLDALRAAGVDPSGLDAILHGTTIATNAVIERRGATCALVTTRGFRDVIELGRRDRPKMYGLTGVHVPLVPRDRRYEVDERLDHHGNVLVPLNEDELRRVGRALKEHGVDSVVISFLHAYANTAHEDRARAILAELEPGWEIVTSTSVVREYYEFERTSTAVVQGYLQPLVSRYARNLARQLAGWGFERDILIMQSNGGVAPLRQLGERSAHIVRSGPAAGVIAAARLAAEAGFSHVITADMGGTSFDVAVVIAGEPKVAEMTNLDFRIPLRLPMIDVHTIGAGGGSIAHLDRGGILQVGPRSAGAVPGPVAYRRGGTEPTVTDANLVLGRINPASQMGGPGTSLDLGGARKAVGDLGARLGLEIEQTAEAILAVVNQRMAGRIRLLSIERGLDPRDFALVAFGGAGPLHGGALIREVGVRTMLVPLYPGVLCAMGCAIADVRYDLSQTIERRLDRLEPGELTAIMRRQREEGEAHLRASDAPIDGIEVAYAADMAYAGQIHSLRVAIQPEWDVARLSQAFSEIYRHEFGNTLGDIPVVVVNLRTVVTGVRRGGTIPRQQAASKGAAAPVTRRPTYFGGWHDTPIYRREDLAPGMHFDGPAIVEQTDTTTVVEPDMRLTVDEMGNLLVGVK